jgi:hypothetical protein
MPFIPLISRATTGAAAPVQRADGPAPVTAFASTAGPEGAELAGGAGADPSTAAVATAQPPSAPGGTEAAERPELDLDELARRLYDRIRRRLRAELLIDRERAGLIADLR